MNIVITGANRGLGLALVKEAAKRGHRLWAGLRDGSDSTALRSMAEERPGTIELVSLEVTDEAGVARLAERLKQEGQPVHSIINNAAVVQARGSKLEDLALSEVQRTMDVNVYGPIRMVKHLLPLLPAEGGTIVNISSASGSFEKAYGGDYPYAISKAALNMFSQQLHRLLSPKGVRVYAVHPGWLRTDMGGSQAPNEPDVPASGILDLAEGRKPCEGPYVFVDHDGEALPI
ncbi:SDR family oxidoreductase [Paenibacillus sp. CC-CFT747]|nr:SDR family oxidoreductase [Paenibacillus sp. CC-CFT747]